MRYLILGSGPAGIAAAKAARKLDKDAEVILATEEHAAPYLRPLLPDLVSGERELSGIADPQGKDLAESGVKLLGGKRARRVDAAKNRVTFSDGSEETYNFLCVATGGRPILPLALMGAPGSFLFLNSLGDAQRVRERAMRSDTTVVYGPGYLGIEAARAMRKLGNQVIWINPGLPRFGNPISGEVEARVTDQLRARGVKVHEGTEIADVIDVDGKNFEVVTAGGWTIRCHLIVVATERLPSIGFLEGSGVKAGAGVLVDDHDCDVILAEAASFRRRHPRREKKCALRSPSARSGRKVSRNSRGWRGRPGGSHGCSGRRSDPETPFPFCLSKRQMVDSVSTFDHGGIPCDT